MSGDLIRLVAGFVLWSLAFVLLYAVQALGCAYGWGEWHRPILVTLYVASLVPLAWLALPQRRTTDEAGSVLATAALWANRAALLAGALVFLPITFASLCL